MIRIVKMTFDPASLTTFLDLFDDVKTKIESVPGCQYVRLVQDQVEPNILMTISEWIDPADLENYRQSDLFQDTWSKTKIHFTAKPEAWSVNEIR